MHDSKLAINHLQLRLRPLHRGLRREIAARASQASQLQRPDLTRVCVTDQHVIQLMEHVEQQLDALAVQQDDDGFLTEEEQAVEARLRDSAGQAGLRLPLDELADQLGLSAAELQALLLCAAPQLDSQYEGVFAYVLDDLNRRYPCVELLRNVIAESLGDRIALGERLGPFGALRRCGLLEAYATEHGELRTCLRLGAGTLAFLIGRNPAQLGLWRDPRVVPTVDTLPETLLHLGDRAPQIARGLASGRVSLLGIWGEPADDRELLAGYVARLAGYPLRRVKTGDWLAEGGENVDRQTIIEALQAAAASGAVLQIDVDSLHDVRHRTAAERLTGLLGESDLPVILAAAEPWRPTLLLARRAYAQLELGTAPLGDRRALWQRLVPDADAGSLDAVASRYRMSSQEVQAVARTARTQASLKDNGSAKQDDQTLAAACAVVAQKSRGQFLRVVRSRRSLEDLVLPAELHRQISEIAEFSTLLPTVSESWGFGRLDAGGGLKCLFSGEPGTGKTLAAEVIAGQIGVPLMKVNIGQTVSKWVGETEKNLDVAFHEAKSNHGLLFFDEADALFGKRGDVKSGVDRYANTEVSHLLQRLEDHDGLVILATNLKENIDPAFTRRFHVVVPFPRPGEGERRRIWRLAFPPQCPLGETVDLDAVTRLDMTGASIVAAARTAALLAASDDSPSILMSHVVQGIARQFRREARILTPDDLGSYGRLL